VNKIEKIAKSITVHEGKPGDPNYRYNNPGNIVWGELTRSFGAKSYWTARTGHKFAIFPTYDQGFACLVKLLTNAFTGKSTMYNPQMTLLDFFSKYSPVRNKQGQLVKNYAYANSVSKQTGISINTKIGTLIGTESGEEKLREETKLDWPIDKVYITQKFGERPEVYKQFGMKGHNGIDFRTRFIDSPLGRRYITAAKKGKVIEVGNQGNGGYGVFIRLQHDGTEQTLYGHLKKAYVIVGEVVGTGERIGLSDNTGFSTGAHLHFSWRKDGWEKNYNNGYKGWVDCINFFPPS
jgi:murein DD-endopeptidase MepM/ murein hydrolase activator NlpD